MPARSPKYILELTSYELTLLLRAMQNTTDTKANNALFDKIEKLSDKRWVVEGPSARA